VGDVRIWNPAAANGVLYLNMGDRNSIRGLAEGAGNELYTIERVGADASGEILRVVFSGRETIFKGVKKLVAYGGAGTTTSTSRRVSPPMSSSMAATATTSSSTTAAGTCRVVRRCRRRLHGHRRQQHHGLPVRR
jgi:hypothetical protein